MKAFIKSGSLLFKCTVFECDQGISSKTEETLSASIPTINRNVVKAGEEETRSHHSAFPHQIYFSLQSNMVLPFQTDLFFWLGCAISYLGEYVGIDIYSILPPFRIKSMPSPPGGLWPESFSGLIK